MLIPTFIVIYSVSNPLISPFLSTQCRYKLKKKIEPLDTFSHARTSALYFICIFLDRTFKLLLNINDKISIKICWADWIKSFYIHFNFSLY